MRGIGKSVLVCLGLVVFGLTVGACSGATPDTGVFLVIDSDYSVPDELDRVSVSVGPMGSATGMLNGADAIVLPATLAVLRTGGELGPFRIRVTGSVDGTVVADRIIRISFIEGRILELPVFLTSACRTVLCGGDTTCIAGACQSVDLDASRLSELDAGAAAIDSGPGELDGGPGDGGPGDGDAGSDAGP